MSSGKWEIFVLKARHLVPNGNKVDKYVHLVSIYFHLKASTMMCALFFDLSPGY